MIPPFLVGQNLTNITIAGGTVDANGNIQWTAAQDIRAYINEVAPSARRDTEDIRPIWSIQKHHVAIGAGHFLRISCLQRSNGANVLRLIYNYSVARVSWRQGTETFTGDYTVAGWEGGVRNRGANYSVLDLEPVDTGAQTQITVT